MKKIVSLVCIMLLILSFSIPASAASQLGFVEDVHEEILQETDSSLSNPVVRASLTSFSFNLSSSTSKKSSETYYIYQGKGSLYISSLTWSPTGQNIKVGYYNVETGKTYVVEYSGGSVTDKTLGTKNVPDGEYRIYVYNAGTKIVEGTISYQMS